MTEEKRIYDLPVDKILPNRFQPRIMFNENQIYELSESIKLHGVFNPIIVRKLGDKYEIIAGERRYKASILAGKPTIPAIISSVNDDESMKIALLENVQRSDLTPIEEAISYKKISDATNINQEKLAQMLGKTQATVANKMRLLKLCEEVQEALLENKISERHARSLLRLKEEKDQISFLNKIISERLTVRKLDQEIDEFLNSQTKVENNNILSVPYKEEEVKNMNENNNVFFNTTPMKEMNFFNEPKPMTPPLQDETVTPVIEETPQFNENKMSNNDLFTNVFNMKFEDTKSTNIEPIKEETSNNILEEIVEVPVEEEKNIINPFIQSNQNINTNQFINQVENIPSNNIINESISSVSDEVITPVEDASSIISDEVITPVEEASPIISDEVITPVEDVSPIISDEVITPIAEENNNNIELSKFNNISKVEDVLKKFRDCVSELKSLGYKIDMTEFDLDTMYQLIIKMEK